LLQEILADKTETTFNQITVDGDTSTNDMVLVLANGLAENPVIEKNSKAFEQLLEPTTFLATKRASLPLSAPTTCASINLVAPSPSLAIFFANVLANGLAENPVIEKNSKAFEQFVAMFQLVSETLAKKFSSSFAVFGNLLC
jgi:N-acetylglutamate synthase/N-acetylornithine aminotransferase